MLRINKYKIRINKYRGKMKKYRRKIKRYKERYYKLLNWIDKFRVSEDNYK